MKALTERLEWLRIYITESTPKDAFAEVVKQAALDEWIACNAIAEALPEIELPADWKPPRKPPERIIEIG